MNERWRKDQCSRTLSYFSQQAPTLVNRDTMNELIRIFEKTAEPVRLCLHSSPEELLHNMIVLLPRTNEVQPHFHPHKEETLQVMSGRLGLIHYDKNGQTMERFTLEPGDLFRVPRNYIHWTRPLSDYVIFHESASGPYDFETNFIRPSWAPHPEDHLACEQWIKRTDDLFKEQK